MKKRKMNWEDRMQMTLKIVNLFDRTDVIIKQTINITKCTWSQRGTLTRQVNETYCEKGKKMLKQCNIHKTEKHYKSNNE